MTCYKWVNDYIGMPYLANGRGDAVDCYGLVMKVMQDQHGVKMPDWSVEHYSRSGAEDLLSDKAQESINKNMMTQVYGPQDFDIVLVHRFTRCLHIGIVINGGVLHTQSKAANWETISCFKRKFGNVRFYRWQ